MGYSMVNRGKADDPKFDYLGVIKDINSAFYPVIFDFSNGRLRYRDEARTDTGGNFFRPGTAVGPWVDIQGADLTLLSKFGCSKTDTTPVLPTNATRAQFESMFHTGDGAPGGIWAFANFQSRWVVDQMVTAYLRGTRNNFFSAVMFDDGARNSIPTCANKDVNRDGRYYPSWKDGQKDLIRRVTNALRADISPLGAPYLIGMNIWQVYSSNIASTYGAWYADGSLRLDLYYLERGTAGGNVQTANDEDPQTGLPAFTYSGRGIPRNYIPADRVVLSTAQTTFPPFSTFLPEHLKVAGIAGAQGSWFGFIVGMNIDKTYSNGAWVFNNTLQLLRSMPNWDNLAGVPIKSRKYDAGTLTYTSPNSYASPSVIYSRNPMNRELYAVFTKTTGTIKLNTGEYVGSALFTDDTFNTTTTSATSCLRSNGGTITLACSNYVGKGIRIKLAKSY